MRLIQRQWGRGEGHPTADTPTRLQARRPSSPHPSPPSAGGEGEETGALKNVKTKSNSLARFPVVLMFRWTP